ncbi:hypothetical protein [Raineyella fluvialis]|uniref:Uncharacterized protein n=1 Tax=Raineyella fluvialis TaxID=2662261 RepID=A0A5Q2FI88_9ACTN|nr:hypothetical protein [Raineyella fluvialis]QGF24375.1 hypothetical protein Rai3103_12690 [Raineyella fluvialis]
MAPAHGEGVGDLAAGGLVGGVEQGGDLQDGELRDQGAAVPAEVDHCFPAGQQGLLGRGGGGEGGEVGGDRELAGLHRGLQGA